jgi:isopenicillin-N epimerase
MRKWEFWGGNDDCFNGFIDIYVTNAHKWFSSPRGAAIIFCANPLLRDTILRQPAVISHGVDDGYLSRFLWDGCRDYTAQLSLPVITDYWDSVNTDNVRDEMRRNLLEGLHTLISKWHPEVSEDNKDDLDVSSILKKSVEAKLTLVPLEMHAPMMALVRLPDHMSGCSVDKKTSTDAKRIQDILYSQNVEVPVKCIRGVLYARVSCHLYNTADEFEILAKVPLK